MSVDEEFENVWRRNLVINQRSGSFLTGGRKEIFIAINNHVEQKTVFVVSTARDGNVRLIQGVR